MSLGFLTVSCLSCGSTVPQKTFSHAFRLKVFWGAPKSFLGHDPKFFGARVLNRRRSTGARNEFGDARSVHKIDGGGLFFLWFESSRKSKVERIHLVHRRHSNSFGAFCSRGGGGGAPLPRIGPCNDIENAVRFFRFRHCRFSRDFC